MELKNQDQVKAEQNVPPAMSHAALVPCSGHGYKTEESGLRMICFCRAKLFTNYILLSSFSMGLAALNVLSVTNFICWEPGMVSFLWDGGSICSQEQKGIDDR